MANWVIPNKKIGIDGLIGSNKSIVVQYLREKDSQDYYIVEDPVTKYNEYYDSREKRYSPLECFYKDNIDALPLQLHVLECWRQKLEKVADDMTRIGVNYSAMVYGRTPTSALVFTKAMHELGKIGKMGYDYFVSKYETLIEDYEEFLPRDIIYFDTPVSVCMRRIRRRGRSGEISFPQMRNYLEQLKDEGIELYSTNLSFNSTITLNQTLMSRVNEVERLIENM